MTHRLRWQKLMSLRLSWLAAAKPQSDKAQGVKQASHKIWKLIVLACIVERQAIAQDAKTPEEFSNALLGDCVLPPEEGVTIAAGGTGDWRFILPEPGGDGRRVVYYVEQTRTQVHVECGPLATVDGKLMKGEDRKALGTIELLDDGVSVYVTWTPTGKRTDASDAPAFLARDQKSGLTVRLRLGKPPDSPTTARVSAESIVFLLDASGSMAGDRLRRAKDALFGCLASIASRAEFAVVVLFDCGQVQTLVPFTTEPSVLREAIEPIEAKGGTPLADALNCAFEYLHKHARNGPSHRRIVFLSDGQETCGRNPQEVVAGWDPRLRRQQVFQVIGLEVTGTDREALEGIAKAAGGQFREATTESVGEDMKLALPMRYER